MEKKQIIELVSRIKDKFPDEFFRLSKEEKYEYIETFERLFIKYDFDLVDKALTRIFKMRYLWSSQEKIDTLKKRIKILIQFYIELGFYILKHN